MLAVVLAGGMGSRLKSVVSDVPKPLASINGRPFLDYLLSYWQKQGVAHFVLSVGYMKEKIQDHFKDSFQGAKISYVEEKQPLGTGGAILNALDSIDAQEFLLLNGDSFFKVDLQDLRLFHRYKESSMTLSLLQLEENSRYSGVVLDKNASISYFAKREVDSEHLLINGGVYLINKDVFSHLPWKKGDSFSLEDDFFPLSIKSKKLFGLPFKESFIDIGIPDDYNLAQTFFNE